MSENETNNDAAFLLRVPQDEERKRYSLPVRFVNQPQMWFRNPDDVGEVRKRLQAGHDSEAIQRELVSGSGHLQNEYKEPFGEKDYRVTPLDNLRGGQ